jgi:metal-responsive CopG/Arc/MetJ family transcriptional regulator
MKNKLNQEQLSRKGRYGEIQSVTISLPASIVQQVEDRRGFDSRSRYILRAVDKYLREEGEGERNEVQNKRR